MKAAWIAFWLLVFAPRVGAADRVIVLELADSIQPASLRYIERGLREAAANDTELVVIQLDTPGGLLTSLRSMTSAILRSPVPVVVYVAPPGARAASAGFFLLIAADVAAMAPGTNAGAAHPVTLGSPKTDDDDKPVEDVAGEKATQDAAALARALAKQRGRSVKWAEKAVTESRAYSADEARDRGLIDKVATSREQLLSELDGVTVRRPDGTTDTLYLRGLEVVVLERTFAERVLAVIADPQIAYLLLMIGAIGLLLELMSPGVIVPGVLGAISLLVGMYGLSMLPVSWVGALLIAAGLALIIAEVFVVSYGLLAVGGLASFAIGSLMLVDAPIPSLRIGPEVVIPAVVVLAGMAALLMARAIRSRKLRPQSGVEAMLGELGRVINEIDHTHEGTVFVHGEYWTATAPQRLPPGARVRIERVEGHRLHVTPDEGESS
jgi:membrane-bound serine protease (ClpP class)